MTTAWYGDASGAPLLRSPDAWVSQVRGLQAALLSLAGQERGALEVAARVGRVSVARPHIPFVAVIQPGLSPDPRPQPTGSGSASRISFA